MSAVVQLADVTVRRGNNVILDDLDWSVMDDERWVIVGPNGAGKTTLLQILAAQTFPTTGLVGILDEILGAVDKPHTIKGRTCPYTALPRFNSSRPCRIFHGPPDAKMQREGKPLGQESDHTTNGIDVIADIDTIHPKMTGLRFP